MRSAILLAACLFFAALLLVPIALQLPGSSGGLHGLAIAGVICLISGLLSEFGALFLASTSPLGAMLVGMMVRMILPLGVCVGLVATGQSGRQHLAFIGYLLTFYIVTLVLETCLAVKRASGHSNQLKQTPR